MNKNNSVTITLPDNGMCAIVKKINGRYEIDTGRVEGKNIFLGPQPDPDTGLVPCGCGGVAEQMDFHDGFFYHSKVECPECGIEIMRAGYTTEEAHDMTKEAWNTAMGWRKQNDKR